MTKQHLLGAPVYMSWLTLLPICAGHLYPLGIGRFALWLRDFLDSYELFTCKKPFTPLPLFATNAVRGVT